MNVPSLVDRARADFIEMPRLPVYRNASTAFLRLTLSQAVRTSREPARLPYYIDVSRTMNQDKAV